MGQLRLPSPDPEGYRGKFTSPCSSSAHDPAAVMHNVSASFPAPEFAGEAGLRHATALVRSLSSSSLASRSFPARWHSIRARLDRLASALEDAGSTAAAAGGASSIGNLVLQELLVDIAATVAETEELARLCAGGEENILGGRLLMLSNLDLAVAKFDLHARSLAGLYSSGILANAAVLPPRPAGRDGARLYVRDLLARAATGGSRVKARALTALAALLRDGEGHVRTAAADAPELLPAIVGALENRDPEVQEAAAEAVSAVAGVDSYGRHLASAGAVPALLRVVEAGSGSGRESAARALRKLTENSDNAWAVAASGGVPALLDALRGGAPPELLAAACGVLRNLAPVPEIRAYMIASGVVPAAMQLLRSGGEDSRTHATELLLRLTADDEEARAEALREGAVEALVGLLDPARSSAKIRETALRAIEALCCPATSGALMSSGFLERALALLRSGEASAQEPALRASSLLLGTSEEARRAVGESGLMTELVKLLDARSVAVREMAAKALSSVVAVHRNQRRFVEEDEENVGRILHVLANRSDEKPLTSKFLLSALASLSDSNAARRKIAASGYVRTLEGMPDGDARRIVRRVAGGRFRSLLHGFWGN